jgi:hypothetical protein
MTPYWYRLDTLEAVSQTRRSLYGASELHDRSAPAKRRARARVGESEGQSWDRIFQGATCVFKAWTGC